MELEVLVACVTDGVVWVKLLLRLFTIADVAVEDTPAVSKEVAGLINRAGGRMFLWLRRMAGGAGRVAWRRFLAARGILGQTKRTRQASPYEEGWFVG